MSVLDVTDLTVRAGATGPTIVEHIDFSLDAGEILGVVGESGSGKTTLGLAILGYGRDGAVITGGDVRISGRSMVHGSPAEISRLRGDLVSYVPQDPASSLNPARRIGTQLREVLQIRRDRNGEARIAELLHEMDLPSGRSFLRRYPHELSGGQQQRVLLVLAFLRRPSVVVLDEPTTGLDVTTQARVLSMIRDACQRHGAAAIFVSHDLDVVGTLAHRVLVLYGGRVAERGPTGALFVDPQHRYTAALLHAAPSLEASQQLAGIAGRAPRLSERADGCAFAPRCAASDEKCEKPAPPSELGEGHVAYCHHPVHDTIAAAVPRPRQRPTRLASTSTLVAQGLRAGYGGVEVLHGVDLEVRRGQCVALVGESGSGKTTLSQCLGGLHGPSAGAVLLDGRPLAAIARDRSLDDRRALQYVFQNPYGSLNPRKTVRQLLDQPAAVLGLEASEAEAWIERVQLGPHVLGMRPHQLSGGERQRVAIARALTTNPEFLICDEITSALDVSIQASVITLLQQLQSETGVGLLFVTHNLPLVAAIADDVVVMRAGEVVERGPVVAVVHEPTAAYTKELMDAVPRRERSLDIVASTSRERSPKERSPATGAIRSDENEVAVP